MYELGEKVTADKAPSEHFVQTAAIDKAPDREPSLLDGLTTAQLKEWAKANSIAIPADVKGKENTLDYLIKRAAALNIDIALNPAGNADDLSKMNEVQLREFAKAKGIDVPQDMSGAAIIKAHIELKLQA